ncbi:insulinase family protein [bacterium]|nr:insulinase family protein [bacterium]
MRFWFSSCVLVLGMAMMVNAQTPQVDGPDRSQRPVIGSPAPLRLPAIQKYNLSNGIPVWVMNKDDSYLATISIIVDAGANKEPTDKLGVAYLTTEMLRAGTEKYDTISFTDKLGDLGAILFNYSNEFYTELVIRMTNRNLEGGVEILEEAVRHPVFPDKELKRIKGDVLTNFIQSRKSPSTLANRAFLHRVYAQEPGNRQAVPVDGTAKTCASITRDDVVKFHKENYVPENISIFVAGNANTELVLSTLEKHFGSWQSSGLNDHKRIKVSDKVNKIAKKDQGQTIYVVDRPGSAQSVIRVGCIGYECNRRDYFPLKVMNEVLGGSFMSHLNQNLRERNGYTYVASSRFELLSEPGPFRVSADVQTDKTVPALKEILKEIRSMRNPIAKEELDRVKKHICYSLPEKFETSARLTTQMLHISLYNLPDDYLSTYVDNIMKVDNEAMEPYRVSFFGTRPMEVVIVGDAKAIAEQLKGVPEFHMELLPIEEFMGPEVKPD